MRRAHSFLPYLLLLRSRTVVARLGKGGREARRRSGGKEYGRLHTHTHTHACHTTSREARLYCAQECVHRPSQARVSHSTQNGAAHCARPSTSGWWPPRHVRASCGGGLPPPVLRRTRRPPPLPLRAAPPPAPSTRSASCLTPASSATRSARLRAGGRAVVVDGEGRRRESIGRQHFPRARRPPHARTAAPLPARDAP